LAYKRHAWRRHENEKNKNSKSTADELLERFDLQAFFREAMMIKKVPAAFKKRKPFQNEKTHSTLKSQSP